MNKSLADHMGMLATVMNSVAIYDALKRNDVECRRFTAFEIAGIGERYSVTEADRSSKEGRGSHCQRWYRGSILYYGYGCIA